MLVDAIYNGVIPLSLLSDSSSMKLARIVVTKISACSTISRASASLTESPL